jgi:hypothetical protein
MAWTPANSAGDLAEALAERGRQLPGVNGERGDAEAFAAAWSSLTGARCGIPPLPGGNSAAPWREFRRCLAGIPPLPAVPARPAHAA